MNRNGSNEVACMECDKIHVEWWVIGDDEEFWVDCDCSNEPFPAYKVLKFE